MNAIFGTHYTTYIVTNPGRTTFYTGVTNDIKLRLNQHFDQRGKKATFAGKYYCYELVYYENYFYINDAILREKEIKNMSRAAKLEMIRSSNPGLNKLSVEG